jgi:O-antigen ligase
LPLFAVLLSGCRTWFSVAGPLAGCIVAVMTTSRATVGLVVMGMGLIYVISMMRKLTQQKAAMGLLAVFAVAVLAPVAVSSFDKRFKGGPIADGEYDERVAFVDTARGILTDYPFGVGANNFVIVANVGGYFDRAQVTWAVGSRGAHVHNIYWLTLAETGYLGLAALLFLLFVPLKAAIVAGWRHRADRRGDLLLGLGISLLVLYVHCYYEWIFFLAPVQYIFAMNLGLIAGLTQQLGYWRKADDEAPADEAGPAAAAASARVLDEDEREQRRRDDAFWGIEPEVEEGAAAQR